MSYMRPKSLLDILVKADVNTKKQISEAKQQRLLKTKAFLTSIAEEPTTSSSPVLIQTSIRNFFQAAPKTQPPTLTRGGATSNSPELSQTPKNSVGFPTNPFSQTILKACPKFRCKYCPYIDVSGSLCCKTTGQEILTKKNVHCHSSNLIYVITCKTCGKHYVGETKRKLFERLYEHLRNINLAIDAHLDKRGRPVDDNIHPVGLHFAQPDHNGTKDLKIQVLDFVNFHPD
jgi:hypothetical protein